MRRRLLPGRPGPAGAGGPKLPATRSPTGALSVRGQTTDLVYLLHLVTVRFGVRSARTYLQRAMGNPLQLRLVEARRGERVGVVREVEVLHVRTGERSWVRGRRVLPTGEPASQFVPDHLVVIEPEVTGPAARTGQLERDDRVVLHIPVRSYLRFLPEIFSGEGPTGSASRTATRSTALQRAGGGPPARLDAVPDEVDADPLRRFLLLFQHLMTTVTDEVDQLEELIDPLRCAPELLPWLASWVGFELDEGLPLHQQRELVRRAIRLYRTRGTRLGIEEMVSVLTSAPVRVQELTPPSGVVLGRAHLAGGPDVAARYASAEPPGCYLVPKARLRRPRFFVLLLEARQAFHERFGERAEEVLRRIVKVVSRERPAHVHFTLRFDETP